MTNMEIEDIDCVDAPADVTLTLKHFAALLDPQLLLQRSRNLPLRECCWVERTQGFSVNGHVGSICSIQAMCLSAFRNLVVPV